MTTRLFYARAVITAVRLRQMAALKTPGNWPEIEQGLVAVMTGEDATAWWNPLDTEMPAEGATNYNSVGVKNYPSSVVGVDATVRTLELQYYVRLVNLICNPEGVSAVQFARTFSQTPWGGVGDVLPLEIVEDWNKGTRSYLEDRRHVVSGPGPWGYQSNGERFPEDQP